MSDKVQVTCDHPDSGSPARVAWEMAKFLRNLLPEAESKEDRVDAYLDLYARCYHAASGRRLPK